MIKKQKRAIYCIFFIVIFIAINLMFFLLGDHPRHILESIHDYYNSAGSAIFKTLINIIFWIGSILFIGFVLNYDNNLLIRKKEHIVKKIVYLFLIQIVIDIISWFIVSYSGTSIYIYAYRDVTIMINWLLIFNFLSPVHIKTNNNTMLKNVFVISCVLLTCSFIIIDFIYIREYQQVTSSVISDTLKDNRLDNLLNMIAISETMENISEQRRFLLDSIICALFFVIQIFMQPYNYQEEK